MKKSILLFTTFIFFGNTCYAQKNSLSDSDEIKINGVNFMNIKQTYGDETSIKILFENDFTVKESDEPTPRRSFWNNEVYFSFEGEETLNLVTLRLKMGSNLLIGGKNISVGDSIHKLGEVKIFERNDMGGLGMILFVPQDGNCDCSIKVEFEKETTLITKIEYNSW